MDYAATRIVLPFLANNPLQTPDYRWQRASWLREHNLKGSKADDSYTRQARFFQKTFANIVTPADEYKLALRYPLIYSAVQIHHAVYRDVRWALEARILANQESAKIADVIRADVETITTYEKLFFDVRADLHRTDYIVNIVMGHAIHLGINERAYDLLWKLLGYCYGPIILDSLITKITNPQHLGDATQIDPTFVEMGKSSLKKKAALTALAIPVNNYQYRTILETYTRILEIEKDLGNSAETEALIKHNLYTALTSLKDSLRMAPDPVSNGHP